MDSAWIAWAIAAIAVYLWLRERGIRVLEEKTRSERVGPRSNAARSTTAVQPRHGGAGSWGGEPAAPRMPSVGTPPRWVPSAETVAVAGRKIGGMVYVGSTALALSMEKPISACIDPAESVAARGDDLAGAEMGYWPSYAGIGARARATYLEWLATGRSDPDYSVGYVFLYFYGLEHRFFMDEPADSEREEICAEVRRLLDIYGDNRSIRSYLGEFLHVASLYTNSTLAAPVFERDGRELPLPVKYAIGRMLGARMRIAADWMLSWWITHPDTSIRMPVKRAFPEFQALFRVRFEERYPNGLQVKPPRRKLSAAYGAASGTFVLDLRDLMPRVPDISVLTKPVRLAGEIADPVAGELARFSRYLALNPDGRDKIEGHLKLPAAIQPLFGCSELESLRSWAHARIEEGGLAQVRGLLYNAGVYRPDQFGKRQLVQAAEALALLPVGMAPDVRFSFRRPKIDEPVVLFRLADGTVKPEEVGAAYRDALLAVMAGGFVAHSDGTVSDPERRYLRDIVQRTRGLTPSETSRLRADIDWLATVPPALGAFRARLRRVAPGRRRGIGGVALGVAGADGRIEPQEVDAIQKIYRALGIDAGASFKDLHALATSRASSHSVAASSPASPTGSSSAARRTLERDLQSSNPREVVLDPHRVTAIMADTARVATVLQDVFEAEGDSAETASPEVPPRQGDSRLAGLDPACARFLRELLRQSAWPASELNSLAGKFGLMPSGALETLNEWAYERFEEPVIEEDEEFVVNPELAAKLRE